MNITVVEISDKDLFEGVKVLNLRTNQIKTIKFIPINKTISEMVREMKFNPNTDIDFQTVMLNKTRFSLIKD